MEVAVADMAGERRDQGRSGQVLLGLDDAFGELGDRHADVGRPQLQPGRSALAAQAASWRACHSLLRSSCLAVQRKSPPPNSWAISPNRSACSCDARLGAVELQEQGRRDGVGRRPEYRLMASSWTSSSSSMRAIGMPDWMVGITVSTAPSMVVEGDHRRADRLGDAVEPQRDLGDDAQRALGTDEQAGQVVAGGRFARPAGGPDDAPVGQHHGQRQHVLAHGAVAHRVGARGPGRRHAAQRGVGAGVDGKEKTHVAQVLVELLARHAGLRRGSPDPRH